MGSPPPPVSEVTLDAPELFTFDIFGTVIDWKTGLTEACRAHGRPLLDGEFDRVIDVQGLLEQAGQFDLYTSIVLKSLTSVLGLDATSAAAIAETVGNWPLFPEAREGLRRLRTIAPCVAITNSDIHHGAQVRAQLGFDLDGWVCAEEERHYKPERELWDKVAEGRSVRFSPRWWHVSAYADYDLKTAESLSLTRVLVKRPHFRPGPSDLEVNDLLELADRARLAD